MDSLANYNSSSDESPERSTTETKKLKVELAPNVDVEDYTTCNFIPGETTKELAFNVPYDEMARPVNGPLNPFSRSSSSAKTVHTGYAEEYAINEYTFNQLERTYQTFRYTLDPQGSGAIIGDKEKAKELGGKLISDISKRKFKRVRQREDAGDPADASNFKGPWAGFKNEFLFETGNAPTAQEIAASETSRLTSFLNPDSLPEPEEKTIFHQGREMYDYQGRSFVSIPTDIDIDLTTESGSQICYLPKKCVHTWSGHTKGVNAIRFLPKSAHLLLSCSMDSKIKIWDVYHERTCIRTYMGHTKAVRDVSFSHDGTRFVSAGYDKFCKLWDTETGQCISRYEMKGIPNVVKFFPDESNPNVFLAGCQNKKIYQFDTNTDTITTEYDQHLGAINSITFYDNNKRFMSTSNDKTVRAWQFGTPVVVKYIADPMMHAIPTATLSPSKNWMVCQSLDNSIVTYSAKDKLRANKSKSYKGHLVGGYACEISFSPDEKYLTSGDSSGKLFFWDFKTCKIASKINAHESVIMSCLWHPHETSKVATASWDGTIKYWD